jgi:hypothetical protein
MAFAARPVNARGACDDGDVLWHDRDRCFAAHAEGDWQRKAWNTPDPWPEQA